MMPAAINAATASPASPTSREARHDATRELRHRHEPHRHFGVTASMPSEPITSASRSRPGASSASPPNSTVSPSHRQTAHAQYVVQRQPVFQAMHAAGILGHVAADRARDLARRIRSVVQTMRRRRLGDREIANAGLDRGGARERVDSQNAIELRRATAERLRDGAARRPTGLCRRRVARPAPATRGRARARRQPARRFPAARRPSATDDTASVHRTRTAACPRCATRWNAAAASRSMPKRFPAAGSCRARRLSDLGLLGSEDVRPPAFVASTRAATRL